MKITIKKSQGNSPVHDQAFKSNLEVDPSSKCKACQVAFLYCIKWGSPQTNFLQSQHPSQTPIAYNTPARAPPKKKNHRGTDLCVIKSEI